MDSCQWHRLEDVLDSNLNAPRIVRLVRLNNLAKRRRRRSRHHPISRDASDWRTSKLRGVQSAHRKLRMIERVCRLEPQLKFRVLGYRRVLHQRQIEVVNRIAAKEPESEREGSHIVVELERRVTVKSSRR